MKKQKKPENTVEREVLQLNYPPRWLAIKLLEDDTKIIKRVSAQSKGIIESALLVSKEMSTLCQEACFSVIASEGYALRILSQRLLQQSEVKSTFSDKLEWLTTHHILGYFTAVGIIAGLLLWTFL